MHNEKNSYVLKIGRNQDFLNRKLMIMDVWQKNMERNTKKPTLFSVGIWHLQGESNP